MRSRTKSWFLLLFSLTAALLCSEIAIRSFATQNEDGNEFFFSIALFPLRVPITSASRALEEYRNGESRFVYDADLGWVMRPSFTTPDQIYKYNAAGIRDNAETNLVKDEGALRIALFGDSCTHADAVSFEESWGFFLEQELQSQNSKVEVLNFGGSGYGMDQAYLHWEKNGKRFKPDLVLFGFQPENVKRNLNILRPIYTPTNSALPFSKPRFIEGDKQPTLLNSPALPPDQVPLILGDLEHWSLLPHENFYSRFEYEQTFWRQSKLVGLVLSAIYRSNQYVYDSAERAFYDVNKEGGRLALLILEKFKASVESEGAKFVIVHLPRPRHLQQMKNQELNYAGLLSAMNDRFTLIRTEEDLLKLDGRAQIQKLYGHELHFTKEGNQFFAEVVAEFLKRQNL